MANRIIVTGLSIIQDVENVKCVPCNFDFDWMFKYPSTLLWADKIIIPPSIADTIRKLGFPGKHEKIVAKLLKLYFELAESEGLIEIRDPSGILPSAVADHFDKQVTKDRQLLARKYPSNVILGNEKKVPGDFRIQGYRYCGPWLQSLYYSLALSNIWQTKLLLDEKSTQYLTYRFGNHILSAGPEVEGFGEILRQHLPEVDITPSVIRHGECKDCANTKQCETRDMKHLEKVIKSYLRWRNYDEIIEMRRTYEGVANSVRVMPAEVRYREIVRKFKKKEHDISRKVHGLFPKIERWSNLVTICSVPLVVAGVSNGSSLLTGLGAATAGIAQVGKQYVELLKNKYRWICFRQM